MVEHARGAGYFTMVAATGIMASQCIVMLDNLGLGFALWALAALLWLLLTYTIFTAFTIRRDNPRWTKGISGAWLLAVVSTQALAVCSALLAARMGQPLRLELNLLALSVMWLWGGMLYIWMMALIFYRYLFFPFSPGDLSPPYWINMGAMAISTLARLAVDAERAAGAVPGVAAALPQGFTVFYWAPAPGGFPCCCCWASGAMACAAFPLRYDPLYWGAVFPLGMYAACTWRDGQGHGVRLSEPAAPAVLCRGAAGLAAGLRRHAARHWRASCAPHSCWR